MIFIDTGAFIARHLKRDQYYDKAIRYWKNLQTHHERCFMINFVLDETFTMLGRRARLFSFDKHFELAGFKIILQTKY